MKKSLKFSLASLALIAVSAANAAIPLPKPHTETFDVLSSANAVTFSSLYDVTVELNGTNKLKLAITGSAAQFSDISYELIATPLKTVSGSAVNKSGVLTTGFLDSADSTVSLTAGSIYSLRVFGTKDAGFTYGPKSIVSVTTTYGTLTPIPAVPEPETYAMLLAGLGLVGTMIRRRKITIG